MSKYTKLESGRCTPSCHPEHSEGSGEGFFGCCSQNDESGRSMVEMLGVLAVIGVLSVAGIAGYNNAMNKHRANELLNEASKRAVVVAAQAITGKTGEISLSEFGNNSVSGVTFSKAEIKENHIVLTLSGSGLADICAQLKNATGDNTVMKVTKDDCSELTFNADMSAGSTGTEPQNNGCTNGQYRCESGVLEKCVNGVWGTAGTLSGKVCNGDVVETMLCSWEYAQQNWGEHRCHNGQYQVCHDGAGSWLQATPPCGKECDENDNLVDVTESCSLGETRCFRGLYEICKNEAGCVQWVFDWEASSGKYCQGDELVDGICTPGVWSCQNGLSLYCFDDGILAVDPPPFGMICNDEDELVCVEGFEGCNGPDYLRCENGEMKATTPPTGMGCDVGGLWYEGCTDRTGAYHCENGYYMHYDNNPGVCIVEQPPAGKKCDGNTLVDA